jgi:hypothetical protein
MKPIRHFLLITSCSIFTAPAQPLQPEPAPDSAVALEPLVVTGKAEDLLGIARSATKGQANNEELSQRPFLRRGELLEVVPGVIVTQHAGGGKANQYFLRGYNLDHGTDFGISLDGMPVNFRTHAHGQGYSDLNFLVPEFVEGLDYFKGPYFAELGDLSSTGGASYRLFHELPQGIASFTFGENEYYRALLGDSWKVGEGTLTVGGEFSEENGPWQIPDNYQRWNGFVRYHTGDEENYFDITALGYRGTWHSTDQIPLRAIQSGMVDRFGSPQTTDTGETSRYSLQLNWQQKDGNTTTKLDVWGGYYDLDLFSDFTYFLEDPLRGDQFEQFDKRYFTGANLTREWRYDIGKLASTTTAGFQTRMDLIDGIGLYKTQRRERIGTVREDDIFEGSYSLLVDHETQLTPWLRAGAGLRGDLFYFDVASDRSANSGTDWAGIVSPKAQLVFGPWAETEFYLNGGLGFHSNDARGVTISRDPVSGERVDPVDPLVRTKGAEIGMRSNAVPDLTFTAALWVLDSDSEFVYVGDAGRTEAGPGSHRYGMELSAYYRPAKWFTLDGEYAWSHARFVDVPEDESNIPGAVDHMLSAGLTVGQEKGIYSSLRARYFAPRPLEESGRVESKAGFQVNARLGYKWKNWDLAVDCLNLLDREDNDIEYYYESRLPGEAAAGVADIHLHPVEPRQFRVSATYRW